MLNALIFLAPSSVSASLAMKEMALTVEVSNVTTQNSIRLTIEMREYMLIPM